ncbi:hypothetical protein H0H92_016088, partial [Tricholoma furcatifolium]
MAALRLKGQVDTAPIQLAETKKTGEVARDYSRRAFGESLRGDMLRIFRERGIFADSDAVKMSWVNWANLAYKEKLCLLNYPLSARTPGTGFDMRSSKNGIRQKYIDKSNKERKRGSEDCIRIVSWSSDEMNLDINDPNLRDVVLVQNVNGRS